MHQVPSLQQFRAGAELHFAYLCHLHGFHLEDGPANKYNEFSVRFRGKVLSVSVEGFSYGYALGTTIGRNSLFGRVKEEVGLHWLLELRRPDLLAARYPEHRGQLVEMQFQAMALQEAASDLLAGDLGDWPGLVAAAAAGAERLRIEGIAEMRRQEIDRVCARAAEAFRSGDYRKVVKLLLPFEAELSPGQLMKLRMAKRKAEDAA